METNQDTSVKSKKIKLDFKDSKYATGRRKTSIAKVWLKKGTGKIHVNGKNYDSYFKRDSHKMQLVAYAVLIEAVYKLPVKSARIFYTKDLTYEHFKITKEDKIQVLKIKDKLQTILDGGLPPVIDDKLRCLYCYKQKLCKKIAEETVTEPTEYIELEGDQD